ncbi:uncharacterized protein LOC126998485 [Eriocheir sinensis]|uniref:uncharacterized protein LOC126998485 n=1 Tax=Eriocheir sinensis TaxID=95602 RepID=UPI0021C58075|nr:uncharacterized protein LOC126998485 [Eriocheir sinensis]
MLLSILLLASGAVSLASPRVRGPQVSPYGRPLPHHNPQHHSSRAQQGVAAHHNPHNPEFEVVQGSGDADSILIRVNSQNFDQFIERSGVNLNPTYPQKYDASNLQDNSVGVPSQSQFASSPQFNVPANSQPAPVQFTVPANPQSNVAPNTEFSNPSNTQFSNPPSAQFTDPSSAQFSAAPNPQPSAPSGQSESRANVQPAYEVQARHNTPHLSPYNAEFPGGGAGQRVRGQDLLLHSSVSQVLRNTPTSAQLIATRPVLLPLSQRLADNYTLIRPNPVDTFRCDNRVYGYYADQDNDCQIFHVCLPLQQLFPANFTQPITYQFSFICPKHTIFSQDAMVCAWEEEAVPCEYAADLYWMNENFFRKVNKVDGTGMRWAHVNEPRAP